MYKYIVLILLAVIIQYSGQVYAKTETNIQTVKARTVLEELQRGFWLNKRYVNTLKATKSQSLATEGVRQSYFWVEKSNPGYVAVGIFNFHEQGLAFTFTGLQPGEQANSFQLTEVSSYEGDDNLVVLIEESSGDEIQWTYSGRNKRVTESFVRVMPDVATFINKILISGRYTDKKKRTFIFTESGSAKWPDKAFRYRIRLDSLMWPEHCDSFIVVDEKGRYADPPITYGYSWTNGNLYIYEIHYSENGSFCDKKPLYILMPQ